MSSRDMIEEDFENLDRHDRLVLSILRSCDAKSTRMHKLALIINAVLEGKLPESHKPYYYGGFSEEIDSSLTRLLEDGLIMRRGGEFALTDYGREVLNYAINEIKDKEMLKLEEISELLVKSLKELTDKQLLALTYELFPELTEKSLIKDEIKKRDFKGLAVYNIKKKELLKFLKEYSDSFQS